MSVEVLIRDGVLKGKSFWDFKGEVDYVDEWFLMSTPMPLLLLSMGYLLFVLKLGPEYTKSKPAMDLSKLLLLYNFGQVLFSCYLCYQGTKVIWENGLIYSPCLMDKVDSRLLITSLTYIYMVAKLTELSDTIFFVFKKNYRQITFLHVYHHCAMLWITWLTLKYEPSYSTIFLGTLNSYVHVIMYTYYGLSAFPGLSKYLWWKKYITKIQITQFILVILQAAASYSVSGCPPSNTLLVTIFFNALLFTGLFVNFYVKSYKKES